MICSIFAIDAVGGIGKNGTLPWPKDSEDLQWFKKNTTGEVVVMGRNTWEDPMMPKPLPNRINVVVAKKDVTYADKVNMIINTEQSSLKTTLKSLETYFALRNVWIIGGSRLLKGTHQFIERVYLTRFDDSYECDVTIDIDAYLDGFKLVSETPGVKKRFQIYEKLP